IRLDVRAAGTGTKRLRDVLLAPAPAAVGTDEAPRPAEGGNRRDYRRGFVCGPRTEIGGTGGAGRDERAGSDGTEKNLFHRQTPVLNGLHSVARYDRGLALAEVE